MLSFVFIPEPVLLPPMPTGGKAETELHGSVDIKVMVIKQWRGRRPRRVFICRQELRPSPRANEFKLY